MFSLKHRSRTTIIINFIQDCHKLKYDSNKLKKFIEHHFGTFSTIENDDLIIMGRYTDNMLSESILKYFDKYNTINYDYKDDEMVNKIYNLKL